MAPFALTRTATADPSGAYVLLELPVGHYELQVEAKGFPEVHAAGNHPERKRNCHHSGSSRRGRREPDLEVNADAQLIQGTVTSLGKTVSEREVLDLPLNGRNFTQLGLLQPGVVPLTPGLAEAGGSLRAGQAYAVNGQRPESNNFLIDGANNFNGVDGGFVLKPPVDAITEFRILTHNANAEFGQSLGSTTNIITRSGTNRFHGALWEFLRNDVFDATNYFAATTSLSSRTSSAGRSAALSAKTRLSSSDTTRDSATARAKPTLQPCLRWPAERRFFGDLCHGRASSGRLLQQSRTTSSSTSSSTSPIPTTNCLRRLPGA